MLVRFPLRLSCVVLVSLVVAPLPLAAQAGGKFGAREIGRAGLRKGGRPTALAITQALEWLKAHQHENGGWGARTYQRLCPEKHLCSGAGDDSADLRATGLALLAFLGDGSTLSTGPYSENVQRAVAWLRVRSKHPGPVRELRSPTLGRDRAIATLALVEAVGLSGEVADEYRVAAREAIDQLVAEQDPRGGWCLRPGESASDPMTTCWAVMALASARDFRFEVPAVRLDKAHAWLRQLTEPDVDPAMTSATVLARIFLGDSPQVFPELRSLADTVIKQRPAPETGFAPAAPTWLFGAMAMFQMGGGWWNNWRQALEPALLTSQQQGIHLVGSWDPPEGDPGGRVAATATATLTLEVYYRYTKILR